VIAGDHAVDALELEIEETVIDLLATQQPMARDLRLLVAATKIRTTWSAFGDHAVTSRSRPSGCSGPAHRPGSPSSSRWPVRRGRCCPGALDAFVRGDPKLGRKSAGGTIPVDALHHSVFRILLTHMMEDPHIIGAAMDLFLVSRNLERVAESRHQHRGRRRVRGGRKKRIKHHAEE